MYDKFYEVFLPQPEIWKPVKSFEGAYEVSNYGTLRSLDRWVDFIFKGNPVSRLFKGKVLKPKYDKDGYESYCITKGGFRKDIRGHRAVAEAFLENFKELPVVDHKNAKVASNFVWNLQWMTSTQNTIKHYSEEAGLHKPLASLSKYEWLYVGYLYNEGLEYKCICENLGIGAKSPDTLWEGLSGKRLATITGFKKGDFTKRKHPTTKLSTEDVCDIIYQRKVLKLRLKPISEKFNIAESMISRFCSGSRQPEGLELFLSKYGENYK